MRRDHSVSPPADSRARAEAFSLFDLWLEPGGLTEADLEHLFYFGMRAALVAPPETPRAEGVQEVVARWEALLKHELPRLLAAGLEPFALLGIPGRMRPKRGFEPALHRLASFLEPAAGGGDRAGRARFGRSFGRARAAPSRGSRAGAGASAGGARRVRAPRHPAAGDDPAAGRSRSAAGPDPGLESLRRCGWFVPAAIGPASGSGRGT